MPQVPDFVTRRAAKRAKGKHRSWETTEGAYRAAARSQMRAMGLTDEDIAAPFVGIASMHSEVMPCNAGIAPLVEEVKAGVKEAGGTPFAFVDGIGSFIALCSFVVDMELDIDEPTLGGALPARLHALR